MAAAAPFLVWSCKPCGRLPTKRLELKLGLLGQAKRRTECLDALRSGGGGSEGKWGHMGMSIEIPFRLVLKTENNTNPATRRGCLLLIHA